MSKRIFISYRRDDSKADARSIYQRLEPTFGADRLFMDVDTIVKGSDFTQVLKQQLSRSAVMLVIIGRRWLEVRDERGARRIDNPRDYVRAEIGYALTHNIPVIPVMVDGARLPKASELPPELGALANRQAAVVTHENFTNDVDGLARDLQRWMRIRTRWRIPAAAAILLLVAAGAAVVALTNWPDAWTTEQATATPRQAAERRSQVTAALPERKQREAPVASEESDTSVVTAAAGGTQRFKVRVGTTALLTSESILFAVSQPDTIKYSIGVTVAGRSTRIGIGQEYSLEPFGGGSCIVSVLTVRNNTSEFLLKC
jgi:hypothetical protein